MRRSSCFTAMFAVVGLILHSLAWSNQLSSQPRELRDDERVAVTGGSWHPCSVPYPIGAACSDCKTTILSYTVNMGGMVMTMNYYGNCPQLVQNSWCWAVAALGNPTPTCDLNAGNCAGDFTLYYDSVCNNPAGVSSGLACGPSYSGFQAATAGTANGIDCSNQPTPMIFTN